MLGVKKKNKIIWVFFCLSSFLVLGDIFLSLSGFSSPIFFEKFKLYFPPFVVFTHLLYVLSFWRGMFFIFISGLFGFVFELLGTKYGDFLAVGYHYNLDNYDYSIFNIPLVVIIYWILFIYTGYIITDCIWLWRKRNKPDRLNCDLKSFWQMILLSAYIVVGIDFFMDPLMVGLNNWTWHSGGFYYNIPFLNFVGWFLVAILVNLFFRGFEYFWPKEVECEKDEMYFIPLLGYASLFFLFLGMAIKQEIFSLIFWGAIFILPVLFVNIFYLLKKIHER